MESAMAPVKSSVTVASTVRSPSARSPSSSSRRRIAAWLRWFSLSSSFRRRAASRLRCSMIRKNSNTAMAALTAPSHSDGNRPVVVCSNWALRLVDSCSRSWELRKMESAALATWNSSGAVSRISSTDWLTNSSNSREVRSR